MFAKTSSNVEQQIERPQLVIHQTGMPAKYGIHCPNFRSLSMSDLAGEAVSQVYEKGKSFEPDRTRERQPTQTKWKKYAT